MVNGIYIDGRKDATLVDKKWKTTNILRMLQYRSIMQQQENLDGGFYLIHMTSEDSKGKTISCCFNEVLKNTKLKEKVSVVGTDGTGSMTGPHSRFIRSLEVLLNKPLQWSICLLHCNELPLQHILTILDGTTRSPDSFSDPIGKLLGTDVSEWPVVRFKHIQKTT